MPDHDMAPEHGTITLEEHRRRANGKAPEPAPSLPPRHCAGCGVKFQPDVFDQSYCSRKCRRADPDDGASPGDDEADPALVLATRLIGQLLDMAGADVAATLQVGRVRIVVEVAAKPLPAGSSDA